MESLEQKVHNLEIKLKRTEEERNSVLSENDDLQSLLTTATESKSQCESKLVETKRDLFKLNDEFQRLETVCMSNSETIVAINDKLSELLPVKSLLEQVTEESGMIKEELYLLKNRYNVATKLELQTQEQLYESRLLHLESVLEEMKQSESQFLRLAEETNILKDQVDYLRELSVNAMKAETAYANSRNLVKIYENKVLENELKSQFSSLYQSLSNLRGVSTLDKDMLLAATSSPEVEEVLPIKPPITHEISEPLPMTNSVDDDEEGEYSLKDEEDGSKYLLVQGKLKLTNITKKEKRVMPVAFQGFKHDKVNMLADIITKMWIIFFD